MFLDVMGGQQKGRVYGLGSEVTQYYNFGSTSSAFDVSQQNAEVIRQLQHRINDQDLMIRDLRETTLWNPGKFNFFFSENERIGNSYPERYKQNPRSFSRPRMMKWVTPLESSREI